MRKEIPTADELKKLPADGGSEFNRLVFEKSPYLLQHAANPVDWYPWGDEAFEQARRQNKPVFLSIGYSTCHWCHVMERESFEDDDVAHYLNAHFISIKVDREEREDIDKIYMSVCTAMTGSGGWPLTIVMTPDKRPFFAGTYFSKTSRFGRPGLLDLLARIVELWTQDHAKVLESADKIAEAMSSEEESGERPKLTRDFLETALDQFRSRYDRVHGGFGHAPKFPSPHNYSFLLRAGGTEMVDQSLKAMRLGGIFDQVGFGFHRYSTDRVWLLPHFEKMLYDQAMLTIAYTEAHLATRDPFHAQVTREILAYVQRDMTAPEGGFFSAEDADSEGEEGKFYVWSKREFVSILGKKIGERFAEVFSIEDGGNFEDQATGERPGTNILHLSKPLGDPEWESARQKLFETRERRIHPHKDDKILTSWNGLMIAAFAKAAAALDEPRYAEAAARAGDFLLTRLRRADGRLLRRYRQGEAAIPGFVDDYAFLVWGLVELYEATFEVRHLERALELTGQMDKIFGDESAGGYFFEGHDDEKLFMRKKDLDDGAIPSGNSVAALNLLRLARLTGDPKLQDRADRLLEAFAGEVARLPMAYAQFLTALDFALGPTQEIVIAGPRDQARGLVRAAQNKFLPRAVILLHAPGEGLERVADYVKAQVPLNGRPAAYVCENFACRRPTSDVREFESML